jgi:hypothetical protein
MAGHDEQQPDTALEELGLDIRLVDFLDVRNDLVGRQALGDTVDFVRICAGSSAHFPSCVESSAAFGLHG